MEKILGIILTTIGILGDALALYLGIAVWEPLNPIPLIIIPVSTIFIGIGIGMISTANERNNRKK